MDRTVPSTGSEEIELYIRTYYSLLRATTDVKIRTLEEVHSAMGSPLHSLARSPRLDVSALIYSSLRLPACIINADHVILGQGEEVFEKCGIHLDNWQAVSARARRRSSYFDGENTLACFIASRSDIDDVIPSLTAFQIEWNKLHDMMRGEQVQAFLLDQVDNDEGMGVLAHGTGVEFDDLIRLRQVWGDEFWSVMQSIASRRKQITVRLLAGSLNDYRRAIQLWWQRVEEAMPFITKRPVYFVSSNIHSIVNLISGFALRHEQELIHYLKQPQNASLLAEWQEIEAQNVPSSRENFLYYILKKFLTTEEGKDLGRIRNEAEQTCGIHRFPCKNRFGLDVQVVELSRMHYDWVDPRLRRSDLDVLKKSDALIINIDYPLGFSSYLILSYIATRVGETRGVYIMGKAASLNGVIGDVMIPSLIHDEHSQNTYLFDNCFSASDVGENIIYGTVLDNQKGVSVRGTFLQTPRYMDVFYREGYTDIEMEAGPYLSAVCEMYRPKRYPKNEIVNLYELPFDLGLLHYASDTPLSKGKNLGAGSLSYFGMDPSYATSLAILKRIFDLETARLLA